MIQSTSSNSAQARYGFENLARFVPKTVTQTGGDGRSDTSSQVSVAASEKSNQLTPEQLRQVDQLKQTDRTVRQHEQAHLSVGRDLVISGPNYSYETGPDKQRYAVSGEVSIDTSPGRTPEETLPKARHIRETALAPANPSAQDRSVAATASRMESEAQIELAALRQEAASSVGQKSAQLYQSVDQGGQLGLRLDFFA
ncbi:MAG: putative metalloprotease CJM1_0395 family protein [Betaproteobacteria bacterium]